MPLPKIETPEQITTHGKPAKRLVKVVKPAKTEHNFFNKALALAKAKQGIVDTPEAEESEE